MKNKKVLLFLAQGFEEYEASVFTDVIGWSRVYGKEPVDLLTTGLRPELKCTWNFTVRPELEFEKINVQDFDALALSLIHISEPTRRTPISYAVFCLKK